MRYPKGPADPMKVIRSSTLIPISFVLTMLSGAFWVGGLAKDVAANTGDVDKVQRDLIELQLNRHALEAELTQRMESMNVTMAEIQAQARATDAKVNLLIQWGSAEHGSHKY